MDACNARLWHFFILWVVFMAQYDGSIRINTKIDTKGFENGGEEIESESRRMAESVSKTADQIKKDIENLENAQKYFLEAGGKKTSPVYQQYEKEIIELQNALQSLKNTQDDSEIADEHWNQLRIDVEEYAKSLKDLQSQGKFFGDEEYDKVYVAWKNATDAVKAYQAELNKKTESGQAKIAEQEAKAAEKREAAQRRAEEQAERALQRENERIQKQIENEAKLEAKEAERKAKEEAKRAKEAAAIQAQEAEEQRLAQIKANATVSDQQIIDLLERRKQLITEIKDMEAAGVGLGYKQYEDANRELEEINGKIKDYRKSLGSVPEKFEKMRKSANKAFGAVASGTKKSSGLLSTFSSRLKGIALSLLIFNWVSKGFNAMISGMKKGFENFMGYSDSYSQSLQNMKNAMSTLGNQFAAAFAPIVQMVIPWLTSLVNAISTAITYVAQFIAILSGKNTFTKAKKVQDDYNKSLGGTAKAADKARGALAKFDDLDILEKPSDAGGGVGEGIGSDMFEEIPVDNEILTFWEKVGESIKFVVDYVNQLKDIFMQGFWDGLGDWQYRWESIKDSLASIKDSLIDIFTDPAVLAAADRWAQSVAYMLGSLAGSMASIGLTIATNLLGGIAKYLEQNKDRIKKYLISMFDIWSEVNYMFANLFQSIAYVFEAFASKQGQQLTANIIGIFTNAFMGITELASKFFRDLAQLIIKPFVDNKEGFRTALEGFLDVLAEVTGTIKQGIDDTFDKLNEVYDEHFKPFFDSVANGLSELVGIFLEFWNENVQPILEEWAEGFDLLWQNHIQPMINSFIDALGGLADLLKVFWEEVLQPLSEWIIEYMGPAFMDVANILYDIVNDTIAYVSDLITRMLDLIKSVIDTIVLLVKGDWKGAWDNAKKIVSDIWEGIKNTIKSAIDAILGWINDLLSKFRDAKKEIQSFQNESAAGGGLGGGWGGAISAVSPMAASIEVPALASGAVLRGGNPFMAILNDQPAGHTNIEAPLATIEQAVENVMSRRGYDNERVPVNINLNYDGETFARLSISDILSELGREGYNVDVLGVT